MVVSVAAGTPAPALPALWPQWAKLALDDPELIERVAMAVGGPFHLLHPETFAENLREFKAALAATDGTVYFAKKANKSPAWLKICAAELAGVDVSSVQELREALGCGVLGGQIMVTGPAKSDELLSLAWRHEALVAVDSLDELERALALTDDLAALRVLLRVHPPAQPNSRFGLAGPERQAALARIAQMGPRVRMEGFSFHLSGYDLAARAELATELVGECLAARALGHRADMISIGGGLPVNYVAAEDWEAFQKGFRPEQCHANKVFPDGFYPYHCPEPGAKALTSILAHRVDGMPLERLLDEAGIKLAVEPGRALLADSGVSVFPVQGFKWREAVPNGGFGGYGIATVAGTSLSLSEQWFGSEFLPDPALWPKTGADQPTPTCVGGASCLDSDMLTWRKLLLPRPPKRGDFLVYPNTAGYQMDSNESSFHDLPIPPKVLLDLSGSQPRWSLEEKS
ncbi:MAG: Y4yA family PLP-dependent enzyme [Segniliparus sp.]|uniref:Y4yA family PLP-dependent enzyme n=1 Tax=Segniliparus sp. TaxID=2804064 RepID=UPI003F32D7EA